MSGTRRILVTGATGFIGRLCLRPLIQAGFDVHAVSRRDPPQADESGVVWHSADLLHPDAPAKLAAEIRPTHCLHMAWYAEHGKFWEATENLEWVEASLRLLRALAANGCTRIVGAGTCAEYDWNAGIGEDKGQCDERTTPTVSASLYGTSKNALRSILAAYCAKEKISWAWGRVFLLYGPGESERRLVPAVIRACIDGQPARCSHGKQIRDFLHVEDVAGAFVALVGSTVEGAVNIGSGTPTSIRTLVDTIVREFPGAKADFGAVPAAPNDPPVLIPRVERLLNEVGWRPKYNLDSGIRQCIEYWRAISPKTGHISG